VQGADHGRTSSKTNTFEKNCRTQGQPQNWSKGDSPQKNFREEICLEAIVKALVAARDAGK
jgi:hypothetical protein